ncbi:MAG TPA: hypothetical protein DEG92_02980 [Rikenellaceae bacterium]|nr:hypothetical protein [Rikenellaceae bacterium]
MFLCALVLTTNIKLLHRAIGVLGSIVMILGVYATYARGALVGCVAGLTVMVAFLLRSPKKYLVLTVLIVSFISIAHVLMPESLNSRFVNTRTEIGEFDESTQGRFYYWESALEIFLKNPMGIGVGQMRGAMESRIGKNVDPHNSFLQTACEYGFVGLVVFVAMLVSVLKKAWEIWLDQSLPEIYRAYALGIGGFIGSFVVSNMFYANFYKDLVMGTVVIYLGMLAFIVAQVTALKERENQ